MPTFDWEKLLGPNGLVVALAIAVPVLWGTMWININARIRNADDRAKSAEGRARIAEIRVDKCEEKHLGCERLLAAATQNIMDLKEAFGYMNHRVETVEKKQHGGA